MNIFGVQFTVGLRHFLNVLVFNKVVELILNNIHFIVICICTHMFIERDDMI